MSFLSPLPICLAIFGVFLVTQHVAVYLWDPKRLRKYPGLNPLCGLTNLAYIFEIWRGDGFRTRAITEAHHQHKIIRLGPNALSFGDIRAIKDIYGHSTTCLKGDMYSTTAGAYRSLLDSVDRLEHGEKRKRLAAAFATKHLEGWEHKIADKCSRMIVQLDRHCASHTQEKAATEETMVDFRKWSNLFTVEAIADIALSENLGLIEAEDDTVMTMDEKGKTRKVNFIRSLHGVGRMAAPIIWSTNAYPPLKRILSLFSKSYQGEVSNNSNYDNIIRQLVSKRIGRQRSGERLDDFFACLVEDKQGKPTNLEVGEIAAEVNVFMNAGSDTTAIALTHVMYYLVKNPDKLQRLREELDQHLTHTETVPSYAAVRNIAYLRACLDESLRLSPPVSFGLQRKTPPDGTSIDGEWISGNTMVSVPAYVAHRDPAIFPEPEKFVPERWLEKEAKEVQKYFIPFSTGARGCIGRNITYIEQHVLLASLLRRYDFALPHPDWVLTWEERFNLWPSAMPLKIRERVK